MLIEDGLAILEGTRFGALANPGATFQIPNDFASAAPIQNGDICFICQFAESSTPTAPTSVIPAGWTADLNSQAMTTADGTGARMTAFHKILTAANESDIFTAMNGTARNRICAIMLRMSRPVQTISRLTPDWAVSTGNPPIITPTLDGSIGDHVVIGFAHGEVSVSDANFAWSPVPIGSAYYLGDDGRGNPSATRSYFSSYPYGNAAFKIIL